MIFGKARSSFYRNPEEVGQGGDVGQNITEQSVILQARNTVGGITPEFRKKPKPHAGRKTA